MTAKLEPSYEVSKAARDKAARNSGRISSARSTNRLVRIAGQPVTITEAEEQTGLPRRLLLRRIKQARAKYGTVEWHHLKERV